MSWLKTKGRLIYDPVREDFKKTHKQQALILQLPRDQLDLYYQWFLTKQYGTWLTLQRPMYGLHITVVRGDERPKFQEHWKKYSNQEIEIEYNPEMIERYWAFWTIEVRSEKLDEIRRELGFKNFHRHHITFGRQYDWQPKE